MPLKPVKFSKTIGIDEITNAKFSEQSSFLVIVPRREQAILRQLWQELEKLFGVRSQ
jgi:hypothetical protein